MRTVALIARILLGLMFVVFGLNGFLHFLPAAPLPGLAGQFITILFESHFAYLVFAGQLLGGIFLLINRYVILALVILAGEIANILMFHITMQPAGIGPGLLAMVLWVIVAYQLRPGLRPIFVRTVDPNSQR